MPKSSKIKPRTGTGMSPVTKAGNLPVGNVASPELAPASDPSRSLLLRHRLRPKVTEYRCELLRQAIRMAAVVDGRYSRVRET